jgi:hypothetical protein
MTISVSSEFENHLALIKVENLTVNCRSVSAAKHLSECFVVNWPATDFLTTTTTMMTMMMMMQFGAVNSPESVDILKLP